MMSLFRIDPQFNFEIFKKLRKIVGFEDVLRSY
jgi:hypothetical protein